MHMLHDRLRAALMRSFKLFLRSLDGDDWTVITERYVVIMQPVITAKLKLLQKEREKERAQTKHESNHQRSLTSVSPSAIWPCDPFRPHSVNISHVYLPPIPMSATRVYARVYADCHTWMRRARGGREGRRKKKEVIGIERRADNRT